MFTLICAVGKNNEIGKNNVMPWHIKEDLLFFKEKTLHHKVVFGRKTYEFLPGKLKNRDIFVISRNYENKDVTVIKDVNKFILENKDTEEEIFICGGASIYELFLPYAKKIYLTEIDSSFEADTFFPALDKTKFKKTLIKESKNEKFNYKFMLYSK